MNKKRKSFILGCVITTLLMTVFQEAAKALPTDWGKVEMSNSTCL
jgi:hypothetical protein